jgi:outer membrane protein
MASVPFLRRATLALSLALTSSAPAAVTLLDAYRSAVEKTEAVALQRSAAEQAEERVDQALGRIYPQLSLLGQYTYQDPVRRPGGILAFTQPDQYNLRFNLVQPLFRGFGEWAELRSRRAARAAEQARERDVRLGLYRTVADAYYAVLAEETDCRNLESIIALTVKQVSELRQRVAIGRSRLGDRLAAEASAASLRAQLMAQRNALAAARETLRAVTGLGFDVELAPASLGPAEPPSLSPLLGELEKRPDIEAAKRQIESAEEAIAVSRAGHWPSVDATANVFLTRTGPLAGSHWDVGVQVVWPLFQGGVVDAAVRENVERTKSAQLTLEQLRRQAEQELRTAHAAAVLAIDQERELARALKLSEQNYEQQLRDYRNGLVTNLEVLNALESLQQTRRGHDRLLHEAQARKVRLEVAAGRSPSL